MIDFNLAGRQQKTSYTEKNPYISFAEAMLKYGLKADELVADGKLHRFDLEEKFDKAGWFVLFDAGEFLAGSFGNWKTGEKQSWCSANKDSFTDEQKNEFENKMAEAKRQRKEEETKNHREAAEKAMSILASSLPVKEHAYLEARKVKGHKGVLISDSGNLLIPLSDESGKTTTLQEIFPDGRKKLLFGGKKIGSSFIFHGNDEKICICEGYSTGATIHEATGYTVIMAVDTSNLFTIAIQTAKKISPEKIIICADNDQFAPTGNAGMKYAQEAADKIGAKLVYPWFDPREPERPTDFNDFVSKNIQYGMSGIEAVKHQIFGQLEEKPEEDKPTKIYDFQPLKPEDTRIKDRLKVRPPEIKYLCYARGVGLYPQNVVGVLTAEGSTGKSFWLGSFATAAASGGHFGEIYFPEKLKVLVLYCEDSQDQVDLRVWNMCKGDIPENLHVHSITGKIGSIMKIENGNPIKTDYWHWLNDTVRMHKGLDMLIIEPKSRIYGLDENNNDHATQWVQALEHIRELNNLKAIIFAHHTGKINGAKISQGMARGASGLIDACRWQGGLVRMDEETAQKYGIKKPRDYILFNAPKNNYSPDMDGNLIYVRGNSGVLEGFDPEKSKQAIRNDDSVIFVAEVLKEIGGKTSNQGEFVNAVMARSGNGYRDTWEKINQAVVSGLISVVTSGKRKTYFVK